MTKPLKVISPPTEAEREGARWAANALKGALADPATIGEASTMHIDLSRPRRGEWWTTWSNLPGFTRIGSSAGTVRFRHALLPGWEYTREEIRAEMIPDLEALAERGVRPTAPSE